MTNTIQDFDWEDRAIADDTTDEGEYVSEEERTLFACIEAEDRDLSVNALSDEPEIEEIAKSFGVNSGNMCDLMERRLRGEA